MDALTWSIMTNETHWTVHPTTLLMNWSYFETAIDDCIQIWVKRAGKKHRQTTKEVYITWATADSTIPRTTRDADSLKPFRIGYYYYNIPNNIMPRIDTILAIDGGSQLY